MRHNTDRYLTPYLLASAVLAALGAHADEAQQNASADTTIETVEVRGKQWGNGYSVKEMNTATRFGLSVLETPQSVSVVTQAQMTDFKLHSLNNVLENSIGINVEEVETDRVYYTARGFDITNFQFDGIGLQIADGNISGDIDMAVFERIEIVRGANGLMTGAGNPSATVNMVRKRPTESFQGAVSGTVGSWDLGRLDGDVSGAFSENARGRLVFATQEKNSYLDRYAHDKTVAYGVVDFNLGENTLLTTGYTWQDNHADSPMWGALPLIYTDGSPTHYDESTSTAADWAFWDSRESQAFVELAHSFANDWEAKALITHISHKENGDLFYVFNRPDPVTEAGPLGYGSAYDENNRVEMFDVYTTGPFMLAGREHELVVGLSWSKNEIDNFSFLSNSFPPIPDLNTWRGDGIVMNLYDAVRGDAEFTDRQKSLYTATRLNITDTLKLLAGARVSDWESKGYSYSVPKSTKHSGIVTPYFGLVYDLADNVSAYASYTDTFTQQTEEDINGDRLDPIEGDSYEIGIKTSFFDEKLIASLAVFKIEQTNIAVSEGLSPITGNESYSAADGVSSQGVELELVGELAEGLQVSFGYTNLDIDVNVDPTKNPEDKNIALFTPHQTLRLATSYQVPAIEGLKMGASINWQSETSRIQAFDVSGFVTTQENYALINVFASYQITAQLSAALNINNITDETYIASLYWDQGYYGAPRNASASLTWSF